MRLTLSASLAESLGPHQHSTHSRAGTAGSQSFVEEITSSIPHPDEPEQSMRHSVPLGAAQKVYEPCRCTITSSTGVPLPEQCPVCLPTDRNQRRKYSDALIRAHLINNVVPIVDIIFLGRGAAEVDSFIRTVKRKALLEGRQRDLQWTADYASTCFSGGALKWLMGLDPAVSGNWVYLQKALLTKYAPENVPIPRYVGALLDKHWS